MKFWCIRKVASNQRFRFPALVKAGWMRPSKRCREATLAWAQTGRLVQTPRRSIRMLNEPPRPRLSADAFGDILWVARPLLMLRPVGLALRARLNQGGECFCSNTTAVTK